MSYAKSCVPHVDKSKVRWIISAPALHLLEQVFKMEHFPSLHMRQRLAADLDVSARQVRACGVRCSGGRWKRGGGASAVGAVDDGVGACTWGYWRRLADAVIQSMLTHGPTPMHRCKCGSKTAGSAIAT